MVQLCHKLANSANQDSIIVKESDGSLYFLKRNGEKDVLSGKMVTGKLGKYYTQLRNKKKPILLSLERLKMGKVYFKDLGSITMREYKEIKSVEEVCTEIICDVCKKSFAVDDDYELQEFTCLDFEGGYASVFGDGVRYQIDICQRCLLKMLEQSGVDLDECSNTE